MHANTSFILLPKKEFWMVQELRLVNVVLGKIINVSFVVQVAFKRTGNDD